MVKKVSISVLPLSRVSAYIRTIKSRTASYDRASLVGSILDKIPPQRAFLALKNTVSDKYADNYTGFERAQMLMDGRVDPFKTALLFMKLDLDLGIQKKGPLPSEKILNFCPDGIWRSEVEKHTADLNRHLYTTVSHEISQIISRLIEPCEYRQDAFIHISRDEIKKMFPVGDTSWEQCLDSSVVDFLGFNASAEQIIYSRKDEPGWKDFKIVYDDENRKVQWCDISESSLAINNLLVDFNPNGAELLDGIRCAIDYHRNGDIRLPQDIYSIFDDFSEGRRTNLDLLKTLAISHENELSEECKELLESIINDKNIGFPAFVRAAKREIELIRLRNQLLRYHVGEMSEDEKEQYNCMYSAFYDAGTLLEEYEHYTMEELLLYAREQEYAKDDIENPTGKATEYFKANRYDFDEFTEMLNRQNARLIREGGTRFRKSLGDFFSGIHAHIPANQRDFLDHHPRIREILSDRIIHIEP